MTRLITLVLLAVAIAAGESSPWDMRWRTWCDAEAGIAFRHPYLWLPENMHDRALDRQRGAGGTVPVKQVEVVVDGRKLMATTRLRAQGASDLEHDVTIFSAVAGDGVILEAAGDAAAKLPLQWTDWNYYKVTPTRPQAEPKSAPKGILAKLGTAADRCAIVLLHGDRISGLVFAGPIDRVSTKQIIDSFEIMGADPSRKGARSTWRERQYRAGKVVQADGRPVDMADRKAKPVAWSAGWEIETQHYHVTGHTAPARLLSHGAYLEALYRTYAELYEPDQMPPLKFEVHVFNLKSDFDAAAAAYGMNTVMGGGGITGGFFTPGLLSLWVYEESGRLGGEDFSVEHVTAHECSHQFLHLACNGSAHVPTWFNEGLAVYFESGVFKNNQFSVLPPRERIARLQAIYARDKCMLTPPATYLDHHGHINADQYGEVYAMVQFFVFGTCDLGCRHKNCGRSRFREYWQALRNHDDGAKAFERIFLDDMIKTKGSRDAALKAWEQALLAYVKRGL